jgi:hypothetical protein
MIFTQNVEFWVMFHEKAWQENRLRATLFYGLKLYCYISQEY